MADSLAQHQQRSDSGLDNLTRCLPASIPLATMLSEVTKIVQTPGLTLIMHELDNATRQIYTDGRPHPVDPNPSWLGYSIGRWEKDTLVVETIGFNGKAPLDIAGHPRSESMRITERYQRRDVGHLDVAITFDDPANYTKPFTIKVTHLLQADTDILESLLQREREGPGPHGARQIRRGPKAATTIAAGRILNRRSVRFCAASPATTSAPRRHRPALRSRGSHGTRRCHPSAS